MAKPDKVYRTLVKEPGKAPEARELTFGGIVQAVGGGFARDIHWRITPTWLWVFCDEDAPMRGDAPNLKVIANVAAGQGTHQLIQGTVVALTRHGGAFRSLDEKRELAAEEWLTEKAVGS